MMTKQEMIAECLMKLRSFRRKMVANIVFGENAFSAGHEYRKYLYILLLIESGKNWNISDHEYDDRYWVKHPDDLEKIYSKYLRDVERS